MGLKLTLTKSISGSNERQVATVLGLGLFKFGSQKVLKDTPAIRGMLKKVRHLVSMEVVAEEPKPRTRLKPKKVRLAAKAAKKATGKS